MSMVQAPFWKTLGTLCVCSISRALYDDATHHAIVSYSVTLPRYGTLIVLE